MWGDIIISLFTTIGEVTCKNFLVKEKLEKFNNGLTKTVNDLFLKFSDTSLDCNDFSKVIKSYPFKEMLRNYFCTLKDGLSKEEYLNKFIDYIYKECPHSKKIEIREFVNRLEELYIKYLSKIIDENYELNALFQLITFAHREIISKILESETNMYKYIDSLDKTKIVIKDADILEYHNICNQEFGKIKFTGISGVESKKPQNINEFYVENTFSYYSKEVLDFYKSNSNKIDTIKLKDFFKYNNKVILIGAAGLGKSTTLNYLFCNYESLFSVNALKIKIDLKEYAKHITEDKKDISWCLSTEFSKRISKAKLVFTDIEKILAQYLDEGKCLVILDALDEIPTQVTRNKVRDEIANFCNVYFLNRFIISTREAGYLKNKFDDSFLHIKINDFDDDQIKKYSFNWYKINYEGLSFENFWEKFNQEVERSKCRDIIRNPIVLILALVIFDIEKNLPNRKVEFYKKCIDTFLEVRENRKAAFEMDQNLRNILGDDSIVPKIAFYKFEKINGDIGYKFTNEELNTAILIAIEVSDTRSWIDPAKRFSKYLIDRTELIREIDENILDFTHKTFYEYFLAIYFSKEYDNDKLLKLLVNWIGDSNYDELARLIIEVIVEKNDPVQHKKLITFLFELINKYEKSKERGKAIDIFSIITELYRNSMLQPKFHELYNVCLIYHPNLVFSINTNILRYQRKYNVEVVYNSLVLAETFTSIVNKDNDQLNFVIESLYYLNAQFRKEVIKRNDICYKYISSLFSWVYNFCYKKKKQKLNILDIKNFFLTERKDLLLSYSSIFISYVDIICLEGKGEYDEILFEYDFSPTSTFIRYTAPKILFVLFENALNTWKDFLILLICLIQCSVQKSNWLFGFVFDNVETKSSMEFNKYFKNSYIIWNLLNKLNGVENFLEEIDEMGVYNVKYLELYKRLYLDYQIREKEIKSHGVNKFFNRFPNLL